MTLNPSKRHKHTNIQSQRTNLFGCCKSKWLTQNECWKALTMACLSMYECECECECEGAQCKHYKNRIDANSVGIRMQTCEIISIGFSVQFVTDKQRILWTICNVMSIRKPIACRHNLVLYTHIVYCLGDETRATSNTQTKYQSWMPTKKTANVKEMRCETEWNAAKPNQTELKSEGKQSLYLKLKRKFICEKRHIAFVHLNVCMLLFSLIF